MRWLITGGAGFIGCNTAARLLRNGDDVIILDDLSRVGATQNLAWLQEWGEFKFIRGDIRDAAVFERIFQEHSGIDAALHLAAQVAVTASVVNPRNDLETNLIGTVNLLEAVRRRSPGTIVLNASTNKVYGKMEDMVVVEKNGRYAFQDEVAVSENRNLDFHSPYGCSKGGAEQYVRDYSRLYGLRTVSFRQSCIYGIRQFGVEDQGWVAWFMIAAVTGKPITIYGDGKQIRDILWVDDLIKCYLDAASHIEKTSGRIYNIGGGPENTLSLLELLAFIEEFLGKKISRVFSDWRPGDQPVYVSDTTKARTDFGWSPETPKADGLRNLLDWVMHHQNLFKEVALSS